MAVAGISLIITLWTLEEERIYIFWSTSYSCHRPFPETALTFAVTFCTSYIANTFSFRCYFLCDFAFFFPALFFMLFSRFALLCSPIHIPCCSDDPVALPDITFWPLTPPLQAPLWAVMLLNPEHREIKVSHKWGSVHTRKFCLWNFGKLSNSTAGCMCSWPLAEMVCPEKGQELQMPASLAQVF